MRRPLKVGPEAGPGAAATPSASAISPRQPQHPGPRPVGHNKHRLRRCAIPRERPRPSIVRLRTSSSSRPPREENAASNYVPSAAEQSPTRSGTRAVGLTEAKGMRTRRRQNSVLIGAEKVWGRSRWFGACVVQLAASEPRLGWRERLRHRCWRNDAEGNHHPTVGPVRQSE